MREEEFSFNGSNWSGGQVKNASPPNLLGLFASRPGTYVINEEGGQVTFDDPVDHVLFYFAHGQGDVESGTATAFDANGIAIGTAQSGDQKIPLLGAKTDGVFPQEVIEECGIRGSLPKPFRKEQLLEIVEEILGK